MNATAWPRDKVIDYMKSVAGKMYRQTHAPFMENQEILETPFSGYFYKEWAGHADSPRSLVHGVLGTAVKYAFAASTNFKGVHLVPGPMGLGGGYVYSALCAVKDHFGYADDDLLRGLFIAGGMGAIAYSRTEPTGEVIGCTGECGICCAMASAAVVEMCGGTPTQVEAAASLALQACLGWPCDPIPGGKFQPCMSRVISATSMAIIFADVALSGKDAVLPYHEVVDAADRIGRQLPPDLLCTSRGGCCGVPSGEKCMEEFKAWRKRTEG
jgi:L-serine dehydratase